MVYELPDELNLLSDSRLPKIFHSAETPFPDIYQAGQGSCSPACPPISTLTGKLVSDRAGK